MFGNSDASDNDILRVCKICELEEYINSLPLKYNTRIEENGKNLSGGQKQRLAIARALLKNPKILIMDEATSNLDYITEKTIENTINKFSKNMTTIIIAHRLSTIKDCDKIFVFKDGQIVETGNHRDLLKQRGIIINFGMDKIRTIFRNDIMKRKLLTRKRKEHIAAYLFILPSFLGIAVFYVVPYIICFIKAYTLEALL